MKSEFSLLYVEGAFFNCYDGHRNFQPPHDGWLRTLLAEYAGLDSALPIAEICPAVSSRCVLGIVQYHCPVTCRAFLVGAMSSKCSSTEN